MNIQKLKQLCTPISEGLPEYDDKYLVVIQLTDTIEIVDYIHYFTMVKRFSSSYPVTAWLDIEKLTTKEKAKEFGRICHKHGIDMECGGDPYISIEDFITQNNERL